MVQTRYKRDPRQMDEDEEAWFDEEEDESMASFRSFLSSRVGSYSPRPATSTTTAGSNLARSRLQQIVAESKSMPTVSAVSGWGSGGQGFQVKVQ